MATAVITSALAGSIQSANLAHAMESGQPGEDWVKIGENCWENHKDYVYVTIKNDSNITQPIDLDQYPVRGIDLEAGAQKRVSIPITGGHNSVPHLYIIKPDGNRYAIEVEKDKSYTYNELLQKQSELAPKERNS